MERPILQGCCCSSSFRKGVNVTPNPSTWHSLGDLYQDVAHCLSSNGPNGKRLIVHFILPGTQIRIDIGNVKAAGVLCVLGISFGIGTYVLYKIYDRFIRPSVRRKPKGEDEEDSEDVYCESNTDEVIMGNQQSSLADIPVYYKKGYGVSLYNWSEDSTVCLRKRHSGEQLAIKDDIIKGNVHPKNGMVGRECGRDGGWEGGQENSNYKEKHRPPSLKELRIDIDDDAFAGDNDNGSGMKLSSSLVGNFSPTSLYEKNSQFTIKPDTDLETDTAYSAVSTEADKNTINGSPKTNSKISNAKLDHLKIDTKLNASSVLLTPPSEDELSTSQQNETQSFSPLSTHNTKSDVSDIPSEVAEPHVYIPDQPETDEEREMLSPLPYDRSPQASPERQFRKKLALKLSQISSRGFVPSLSSNTSSLSSTPDSYHGHRRTGSSGGEKENSLSGISSPELEMINSENSESVMLAEKTFSNIESEIHVVEDEFEELSKQISELTQRYSVQQNVPGAEIFEEIFQRYPSIRVRQSEKGVKYMPSLSEYESANPGSISEDANDSSVFESEEKSVSESGNKTSDMESADLSWDMDNILDIVYSEASESESNPLMEKLKTIPEVQNEMNSSTGTVKPMDASFNSAVDMEGSMYEEDYYLEIGTNALFTKTTSRSEFYRESSKGTSTSPKTEESPADPADLAPADLSPPADNRGTKPTVCNIGARQEIVNYADTEWKGSTTKADTMKKAYREIPNHCHCCHLRRIRGDNYCAVRGAVFQMLVNALPLHHRWASRAEAVQQLTAAYHSSSSGIQHWTFAGRITHMQGNLLDTMTGCVNRLFDKFVELQEHSQYTEREQLVEQLLNSDLDCDLDLMEGVKLLMLLCAINLYNDIQQGNEVPVFAWLLFARDTSETPETLVQNHLNAVGNTGGLEQIEMFLLGYSLGARIQVFRLQQFGMEDFVSYYPDDCSVDCPTISLIAEDDRHYNVPVL